MDNEALVSGVICGVYQAATNGSPKGAILQLKMNHQFIAELAKGECRWGRCRYILHALFWTLRNQTFEDIQSDIPDWDTVKKLLTESAGAVQQLKIPNVEEAEAEIAKYKDANKDVKRNNVVSNNKRKNAGARNAAECAKLVAEHWSEVTTELKKWCEFLGVPWQENNMVVQINGAVPSATKVETKSTKGQGVVPTGLIPLAPDDKRKGRRSEIYIDANGKVRWSVSKLEQELADLLGNKSFAVVKSNYLKAHEQERTLVNSWFVRKGASLYFDPDQLDELKKKFFGTDTVVAGKQSIDKVGAETGRRTGSDGGDLLRLDELAKVLSLSGAAAFSRAKFNLLEYHRKHKNAEEYKKFEDMVESWFVKSGKVKFFKSAHLLELRTLLKEMPHTRGRHRKEEVGGAQVPVPKPAAAQEPTGAQHREENVSPAAPVVGGVDVVAGGLGDKPQGDEFQKLLGAIKGIRLTQVATQILDVLLGQMAEPNNRDKLSTDFADIKTALVNQVKAEREFAEAAQKFLEAEQRLATVVEQYLSKNM